MSEIKASIIEQLQQLQMLMHRASFHSFVARGRMHNPHRGQGRVLSILNIKPEISQKELNYLLNMSKQSLAELLAKLEKNGYITREPSEEDKRVMTIRLTEAGRQAAADAEYTDAEEEPFDTDKILNCLNDEELTAFSEYLGRIIRRYEEQFPDEDYEERRKYMMEFLSRFGRGRGFGRFGDRGANPYDFNERFGGGRGRQRD